ncbi:DUF3157 family protein [Algibacter sp. Ld11]|uniref:DUF3157 family protein n=1 Tax=Algibacter sp. Ld11 TaxID=649150 RepID=UPI00386D4869
MKFTLSVLLLLITAVTFAQKGEIIKTEDGRRVFLKSDFTWEYVDALDTESQTAITESLKPADGNVCSLQADYTEPKLDSKIQSKLKRGHSTIEYVKKKVAKDQNCTVEDVLLLSFSEQKAKAVYHFCANGTKVTYKRLGNSIIKGSKLF